MSPLESAQWELDALYNDADHAKQLVANARGALNSGDYDKARAWLTEASQPADMTTARIRWTLAKVEKL